MRRILPPLLFLLVLATAFAASSAPDIHSISEKNGKYENFEGRLFEFVVNASDAGGGALSYSWNFGDSKDWLETSEPYAGHNYYLGSDSSESSREFTVTVNVSNGKLQSAQSIKVTVKRSSWKIRLKSPGASKNLEKNKPLELKVEVLSRTNNPQSTGSITLDASLGGKKLKMEKKSRYFDVNIPAAYSFHNIELLEIKARSHSRRAQASIPLYFSPAKITVKENPLGEKNVFVGIPIGKVNAELAFENGDVPMDGNFRVEIYSNNEKIADSKMTRKLDFYTADINKALGIEQFFNKNRLVISGIDNYGNRLDRESFDLNFKLNNPEFNIEIKSPSKEELNSFGAGEKINIVADAKSEANLENAELSAFIQGQGTTKLKKTPKGFTGLVQLPNSGQKTIKIAVYGKASIEGKQVSDVETITLNLSNKIAIAFVYPLEGKTTMQGNGKTITVSVKTPSGENFGEKSFQAVLYVDGINQVLQFRKDPKTGNYSASLEKPLTGRHTLKLVIPETGGRSGLAEIHTSISQSFDFIGLSMLLLILAGLGYTLVFALRKLRAPSFELKKQIEKVKAVNPLAGYLKKEMKKLELEFYKRKITEEEFRQKMLELKKASRESLAARKPKPVSAISEIKIPPKKPIPAAMPEQRISSISVGKKPLKPWLYPERPVNPYPKRPVHELAAEKKPFRKPVPAPLSRSTRRPAGATGATGTGLREEERLKSIIEKRLASDSGIQPIVVGRVKHPEPSQPLKPVKTPLAEKAKETVSRAKISEVSEKLGFMARDVIGKPKLSMQEEDAVKKLTLALQEKAAAYTREEIFNSLIKEGFSPRVAREVVKKLFG